MKDIIFRMIMNRDKSSLLLVENKDMEIYEDGENWCHREIFNEDDIMHPKVKNEIENRFYLWYKQLDADKKTFDLK